MAKYKVKVIQHMIKGNKIAKSGDVVDETQLINPKHSIEGGYVELVEENTEAEKTTKKGSKK